MKTLTLILTNLKRFVRNWQSVALLIGFPLLIVGTIFASFSPDSINVPVGAVDRTEDFNFTQFREASSEFADVKEYQGLENCTAEVREYKIYVCTVIDRIEGKDQFRMDVYYDNTREVIDRSVLGGIEEVANSMQVKYSRQRAAQALGEVRNLTQDIRSARNDVQETDQKLKNEVEDLNQKIISLRSTRASLKQQLEQMDENVNETDEDLEKLERTRQDFYTSIDLRLESLSSSLEEIDNETEREFEELNNAQQTLEETEEELDEYNSEMKNEINQVNQMISNYREFRSDSKRYLKQIDQTIKDLKETKRELSNYRDRLQNLDQKLANMEKKYSQASDMNAGEIANFVKVSREQLYNPDDTDSSLLVLQTIFSTLLLLVSLFVSVLISKFVTLNEINSAASKRIEVTPGTFVSKYISVYVTSMIIISVPILCVIAFGQYFFKLHIFSSMAQASLVLFLFCSALVNMGIASAHLIRDESITLLIGSFLIVFLIFFSGFVLPLEMMSPGPKTIASLMPGNMALEAFDLTVLYQQPLEIAKTHILALSAWNIIFIAAALQIKRMRD